MPNSLKILLIGRVASKKNSKQIVFNRKTHKPFIKSSKAFEGFEQMALWQLKRYKSVFTTPVRIHYRFELKGKESIDADNAQASINDVLQKAGILDNDKLVRAGSFEMVYGCKDHQTFLEIETL